MPNSLTRTQDALSPSLLAFKPRQVLLANHNLRMKQSNPNNSPDHKGPLLHAVAKFLEANGFSKTLKRFLSEASLEKNGMKESSLDLEEIYCKYSEMCNKDSTIVSSQMEDGDDPAPEKIARSKDKKKERKKGKNVSDTSAGVEEHKPEQLSGATEDNLIDHTSVKEKDAGDSDTEKKSKEKKKKKNKSNDANQTSETNGGENPLDVKPKGKKNKMQSSSGEDLKVVAIEEASDADLEKGDIKISDVDATDNGNKSSKKRKRLDSVDNDSEPKMSKEDETAEQKSIKKQRNGSTEPKTIKAFQRVKIDDVVFTDEKLKDNSYWAKDGADIGYGAKAQEILGQVRGRDFRHEKTKKKRGTYRGGQIDLQSHSVKFNYSDED